MVKIYSCIFSKIYLIRIIPFAGFFTVLLIVFFYNINKYESAINDFYRITYADSLYGSIHEIYKPKHIRILYNGVYLNVSGSKVYFEASGILETQKLTFLLCKGDSLIKFPNSLGLVIIRNNSFINMTIDTTRLR